MGAVCCVHPVIGRRSTAATSRSSAATPTATAAPGPAAKGLLHDLLQLTLGQLGLLKLLERLYLGGRQHTLGLGNGRLGDLSPAAAKAAPSESAASSTSTQSAKAAPATKATATAITCTATATASPLP
jgi:hypothetical protein